MTPQMIGNRSNDGIETNVQEASFGIEIQRNDILLSQVAPPTGVFRLRWSSGTNDTIANEINVCSSWICVICGREENEKETASCAMIFSGFGYETYSQKHHNLYLKNQPHATHFHSRNTTNHSAKTQNQDSHRFTLSKGFVNFEDWEIQTLKAKFPGHIFYAG